MERWEKAAHAFLEEWKRKKYFLGAAVVGSYPIGYSNVFSDVDLMIILSDTITWRERGSTIVDGFLIEYFANPVKKIKKNIREAQKDRELSTVRMFTTGKILFDKTGVVMKLKREANKQMQKKFPKTSTQWLHEKRYELWDMLDSLRSLHHNRAPHYHYWTHVALHEVVSIYATFLRVEEPNPFRLYSILTDPSFRKAYKASLFPDSTFNTLLRSCITEKNREQLHKKTQKLISHVLKKMGGFNHKKYRYRESL